MSDEMAEVEFSLGECDVRVTAESAAEAREVASTLIEQHIGDEAGNIFIEDERVEVTRLDL